MKTVAFLLDPDPGHVFPTIGIAEVLIQHGFEVHLFGVADLEPVIPKQPTFHSIFIDIYPSGFLLQYKEEQKKERIAITKGNVLFRPHLISLASGDLDHVLQKVNPDLLVIMYSLSLEALLIKGRYPNLNCAFLTTWLRPHHLSPEKQAVESFKMLSTEQKKKLTESLPARDMHKWIIDVSAMPEFIACPAELEFPDRPLVEKARYIGGVIRAKDSKGESHHLQRANGKKIVYFNLGSQTQLFGDQARIVSTTVYNYFLDHNGDNLYLIMALGDIGLDLQPIEGRIEIMTWAPQLEILSVAAVMITHGGLGTIKECIVNAVPMIVVPMIFDQFENAGRVQTHGIGRKLLSEQFTPLTLDAALKEAIGNNSMDQKLRRISGDLQKYERIIVDTFETVGDRKSVKDTL